jgi:hypothetical protein
MGFAVGENRTLRYSLKVRQRPGPALPKYPFDAEQVPYNQWLGGQCPASAEFRVAEMVF